MQSTISFVVFLNISIAFPLQVGARPIGTATTVRRRHRHKRHRKQVHFHGLSTSLVPPRCQQGEPELEGRSPRARSSTSAPRRSCRCRGRCRPGCCRSAGRRRACRRRSRPRARRDSPRRRSRRCRRPRTILSGPSPPHITSSPPRPFTVSAPPSATITSRPAVPLITSLSAVPTRVGREPAAGRDDDRVGAQHRRAVAGAVGAGDRRDATCLPCSCSSRPARARSPCRTSRR